MPRPSRAACIRVFCGLLCAIVAAATLAAQTPGVHPISGRHFAAVMGAEGAAWLDRPEREREEAPEAALDALDIQKGSTAADVGEPLIARRKDLEDSPIPAGGSSAAMGLLRLAELTGDVEYERQALGVLALLREIAPRHPTAFGHLLQALHWRLSPARPIACAVPR